MFISGMDYSQAEYWNDRYSKTSSTGMEWYCSYEHLDDIFDIYLKDNKFDTIVMIGCGKSMLQNDLMNIGGFMDVIGIDISDVVMKQRQNRNNKSEKKAMEGIVMNALSLSFRECSIKCIVDKGTLDAIICNDLEDDTDVNAMLLQIHKCLSINGIYILVSMHNERITMPKLQKNVKWEIEHHMVSYSWRSLYIREFKSLQSINGQNLSNEAMKTMAMNKTFEMLETVCFDEERFKSPDTSKVCHIYVCIKTPNN